jgi:4-hydroxybenzoate polyprenyltransferase
LNPGGAPGTHAATEPQTYAGGTLAARYASFVKLPHTLFALPFAGIGAILASYDHPERLRLSTLLWILIAFTAARFAAMGFNRIVDREYDALNPRTRQRELPSGRLSVRQAWIGVVIAAAVFVTAAWMLNPLCGALAPIALLWVFFYSYTKRFTSAAHVVLGAALGIAPVGAYLAVAGAWPHPWYAPVLLAAGVTLWVAGFDVIYSLQDIQFDREHRLHSIAARFGAARALRFARVFHFAAVAAFLTIAVRRLFSVGWVFFGGVLVMAALLAYEHWLVRPAPAGELDLKRIDRAFFRTNITVSLTLFTFTLLDRLLAPGMMIVRGAGP